jgi:hypothetical protein
MADPTTIATQAADSNVLAVLLSILIGVGTFVGGVATAFIRRHFKFLTAVEEHLQAKNKADEARAKLDGELALELRESREGRAKHDQRLTDLEKALMQKIEDRRYEDLKGAVEAVHHEVRGGGFAPAIGGTRESFDDEDPPKPRERLTSVPEAVGSASSRSGARVLRGSGRQGSASG